MKIKCVQIFPNSIAQEILKEYTLAKNVPLILNKEYIVYALGEYYGHIWFCLADEDFSYYPAWIPGEFFDVVDGQPSRFWIFKMSDNIENRKFILAPAFWSNNVNFYNRLSEGESLEVDVFKKYKELMDLEFPDPTVTDLAQIGDDKWLICPDCIDAWENSSVIDALVRCPNCLKIFNNPRFHLEIDLR